MKTFMSLLIFGLLSCPASAADPPVSAPPSPTIAAAAAREIGRIARSTTPAPRMAPRPQTEQQSKGWVGRHPRLFGALVGFGAGCAIGASQVGGSTDNFYNTLDEFACPAVGGIGAAAGLVVSSLFK